ncbi:threonine/serine exporter family protein [Treponema denticola]|uniref:threonine/serine exporter family protein n=1 Tax=Treponema denticola TaxID=158 RepID=UPI0020A37756|nr:threonine/serine exporter family protein [Treponema denticola]UTC81794.1 threonine/serine exporter [Treponema denticola]
MPLYVHTIASFIASFCFCFLFSVPRKNIYLSGLCGSVSWTILIFFQNIGINYIFATLAGAIAVGLLADLFAVLQKTPVTCFIVIGIIPLVPGFKVYKTMLFFVTDRLEQGVSEGVQAAFIAIAISVGLIISASATRLIKSLKRKLPGKKE